MASKNIKVYLNEILIIEQIVSGKIWLRLAGGGGGMHLLSFVSRVHSRVLIRPHKNRT